MDTLSRGILPLLPSQEDSVTRWQEHATPGSEHEAQGVIARIFGNCYDSLRCIAQCIDPKSASRRDTNALRRCLSVLRLWAEGHDVFTGGLDATLDRSRSLRRTTLSILSPLCKILSEG